MHSLVSTWEPRRGFQDGVDGSSRPGLSLRSSSVWGLRNLGPGKLTLHMAVVDSSYPKCMLCSPEATRQRYTPGIACRLGRVIWHCGHGSPRWPPPSLVPSSPLAATQDAGPHQRLTGVAPQGAAFLCVIRSIIPLPTITFIAWGPLLDYLAVRLPLNHNASRTAPKM